MEGVRCGNHVVQYPPRYSVCTGCASCQLLCGFRKDGFFSPENGGMIFVNGTLKEMIHHVEVCQQCEDHPCYYACPKKDVAMRVDENNVVYIVKEECIGCRKCQKACVFEPSRISIVGKGKGRYATKCDLCRTREEGPLCIEYCPVKCLGMADDPLPYEFDEEGNIITGAIIADAYSG